MPVSGDASMKTLTFFCLSFIAAALALVHPLGAVHAQEAGPPRVAAMEGDVAAAPLSDAEIANLQAFTRVYTVARWFHPSDAALAADWDALAIEAVPQIIEARGDEQLAGVLKDVFAPVVEGFEAGTQKPQPLDLEASAEERLRWLHSGFTGPQNTGYFKRRISFQTLGAGPYFDEQLGHDLWVRFPLSVAASGDEAPEMIAQESFAGKPEGWTPAGFDRTTRIASTLIAWGVFDQFYPYWDVVDIDWDARLELQLQRAAVAPDAAAFGDALRLMLHELRDGHARLVYDRPRRALIPAVFERFGDDIAIAWANEELGIEPGSIVSTIDGRPALEMLLEEMETRTSGAEHLRQRVALDRLKFGPVDSVAELAITSPDGDALIVEVPRIPFSWDVYPQMPRPEPITEMEPGLLYVDLTRADNAAMIGAVDRMTQAKGIVFDLRGGFSGSPIILSHLTDTIALSAQFDVPVYQFPDQAHVQYGDRAWRIVPQMPRLTRNVVFLTNAEAASSPESTLGLVKANGLATIVGSPTGGANGNVTMIDVPGGYRLYFTGMKVINRDGSIHHNLGVLPDVAVQPTLEGIREGRDEVLEAGLAVLRAGLSRP